MSSGFKRGVIIATAFLLSGAGVYIGYFTLSPAVAISNNGGARAEFVVYLPSSRLDFGMVESGHANTIYYSANQGVGRYIYQISLDSQALEGTCGQVENDEFGKRVTLTLTKTNQVHCKTTDMLAFW